MVDLKDYGFFEEDKEEPERGAKPVGTGYPKPHRRFKLNHEIYGESIEEHYFWIQRFMELDLGFGGPVSKLYKLTDSFAAAENSAFGGVSMQRLSIQQDKATQFLATIGKLVKDLFQIVRELRIIEERLILYKESFDKKDLSSEISLKGYWVDLVEGGAKSPSSVYGMAQELGFATLPDLFFGAPALSKGEEIEEYVENLKFNRKVKEVLRRKLKTFIIWKESTYKEWESRFDFTIKYLRQHYATINLYMNWVKPYLKAIKRLSMNQKHLDSSRIISAFESNVVEIEILGVKKVGKTEKYNLCMDVHFLYRARPTMNYVQEGYQRGPLMVGKTMITWRAYIWTDEQVYKFKKMKEEEDLELLGEIDTSLKQAMDNLGGSLKKYLGEKGEKFPEKESPKKKAKKKNNFSLDQSILGPFVSVFKGAFEMFGAIGGFQGFESSKPSSDEPGKCDTCGTEFKTGSKSCSNCGRSFVKTTAIMEYQWEKDKGIVKKKIDGELWLFYKAFKSAHKFLTW